MTRYFKDCKTAEELKKAYKKAARELHPDMNHDRDTTEEFKKMQAEFEQAFERLKSIHVNKDGEQYEKATEETANEFMDMINKLLHFPGVEVELCGSWVWVSGNTRACKDELKKLGFKWSSSKVTWYFHLGPYRKRSKKNMTMDDIREMYGSKTFSGSSNRIETNCQHSSRPASENAKPDHHRMQGIKEIQEVKQMATLAINYKHGKGNVELNLDALMPCNDQDFRRVLSFLDLSDGRREMHVEALRDYILQEMAVLDVILEQEQKKKILDRRKRYQRNLEALIKFYPWLETPQKSFEKQEEKNMNTTYTFTSDSIVRNGKATPAGYSVTPSGAVVAIILDGTRERIRIESTESCYQEALAAAKASNNAAKNKPAVKLAERPTIIPDPEEKPEPEKKDPKQARGPVPEKTFINQTIQGNGWHILFDGTTSRTRVIFDGEPSEKVKKAVSEAGFYYSSVMDSWNKKLTFKAYRAAGELAKKLNKLYQNAA